MDSGKASKNAVQEESISIEKEKKFIKALQKKEIGAYEKLYADYAGLVGGIVRAYLNFDDVDDVVQEVFIRVFKSVRKFKGDSSFGTWLYRITVNVCKDFLKKYSKRAETLSDFDSEEEKTVPVSSKGNLEEEVNRELDLESFKKVLDTMSKEDRLFITLRDIDGLDYEEISRIIEKPIGTVKSRIHYARKKLKKMLEKINYLGPE